MKNLTPMIALLVLMGVAPAWAAEKGDKPQLDGKTIEATTFRLDSLRGKVVLVLFWSTDCAVCRDKMPELRANVQGWVNKPFELVSVSVDRKLQDALDYEKIVSRVVPPGQRFSLIWSGDSGYRDTFGKHAQLPTAYLLDKSGTVIDKYTGRIPSEAWDKIADLL
ncbi:MAG: hypothetical protein RIS34_36 [Pseudomonadota bacterium]|jgi:thiol-disulfide isomerase/thioredoxin